MIQILKFFGVGLLGYGVYTIYNGVTQIKNGAIVVGNPKFLGFSGTKIKIQLPISNVSNLPVTLNGLSASVTAKVGVNGSEKVIGTITITDQQTKIASNHTEYFTIEINPNLLSIGFSAIELIKSGKIKDLGMRLKGAAFTKLATVKFDNQIV